MTHPANKKRTHNAAARAAGQRASDATGVRLPQRRRSPYGARLAAARQRKEQEEPE